MSMFTTDQNYRPELNDNDLFRMAPSIFATQPSEIVSDRYSFIPTIDVINGLRDNGWLPVDAQQTKVRKGEKVDTTLHMIRFRNPDLEPVGNDKIFPEVIMTNSHNRTSAFKFMTGLFRMVCSNGLVTSDANFGSVSVRHNSKAVEESIQAAFGMLDNIPKVVQEIERFKQIELSPIHQEVFAKSALNYKYGSHNQQNEGKDLKIIYANPHEFQREQYIANEQGKDIDLIKYIPVKPDQLLTTRRSQDVGRSLWTTYNKIQENLMNTSLKGYSPSGRRSTTRGVTAINQNVNLNKALWSMTTYLADRIAA